MGQKASKFINKYIRYYIKLIYKSLIEIIYPRDEHCVVCKKEEVEGICNSCVKKIKKCNEEEAYGYYGGILKELILRFKYYKDFNAGLVLVDFLEDKLLVEEEYLITYIPGSRKSLKDRGFNQCEFLAKELAFRKNLPCLSTLIKIKETKIQKTLRKEERKINIEGAFLAYEKRVKNKKIILIDDVITSGATLKEGVRALLQAGALEIKILTVAKSDI